MNRMSFWMAAVVVLGLSVGVQMHAHAFCGFYVGGAGAQLYNNATQVVLMREGKRTVLSMQNNYQGPPSNFAMVVPVPVVLQKENVKTLPKSIFNKVDQMASPRLVEYWEQDPCPRGRDGIGDLHGMGVARGAGGMGLKATMGAKPRSRVRVEAQFKAGEYEIVILSATESTALDRWLRQNKYNIPKGAEKALGPYIEQGMYFFVAKVNADKVKFENGQATLSPLRFYYDSDTFALPTRLGLLNAQGKQDLIVHILARGQRYEVANYKNVTIPTNIAVTEKTKPRFGEFYAALFDRTLKANPGSVVTEYSWDASTCDPCPGPTLNGADFMTLGADVMRSRQPRGFVLTRLHARYDATNLGQDLVFRAAAPIVGGRQVFAKNGELEQRSKPGNRNNFQGRYIIYHPWRGAVACRNPRRGIWGGPPNGGYHRPMAAQRTAFAPRGKVQLNAMVHQNIPEIGVRSWRRRNFYKRR